MNFPAVVTLAQPTEHPPDTMAARLRGLPRPARSGHGQRLFPASGRQAGGLSDEPARRVPRRPPPLSADELSSRIPCPTAYLQQIADYFAALRPPPVPQRGRRRRAALCWRAGARWSPKAIRRMACRPARGCHGPALTGMEPAIPGLVGLHASYISAQLGAWRYGTRTAVAPGLHADRRRAPDRERRHRGRGLARRRCRSRPTRRRCRTARCDAACLRQRTELNEDARMRIRWTCRSCHPAGGCCRAPTAARADDATLIAKGEYLARAGDCIACHTDPGGACSPAACRCRRRSARSTRPTSRPIARPASARGPPTSSTAPMHTGRFPDGGLIYPAMPFGVLHQGHARGFRRDLRLSALGAAGAPAEPAARPAISLQQPLADPGLAHAVLPGRRVQPDPAEIGRMEPRRLSGRRAWAIAACATRRSTRWAAARNRRRSRAG